MKPDSRDMLGGAVIIGFGLFMAAFAFNRYNMGNLASIGPGMFPAMIGVLLAGLGALIVGAALFRRWRDIASEGRALELEPQPQWEWRPFLFVILSLAAFALLVTRVGMAPAIVAVVGVASIGDRRLGVVHFVLLSVGMTALAMAIFGYGLGLPIRFWRWPF